MKKIVLAVLVVAGFAAAASAQQAAHVPAAGTASFCDPAFQDFVETTYGYLNPRTGIAARFRDSVASPAVSSASSSGYVFVSILPRGGDYNALLGELTSAGFVLKGERVRTVKGVKQVRIVGWARAGSIEALRALPGVSGLRTGKKVAAL